MTVLTPPFATAARAFPEMIAREKSELITQHRSTTRALCANLVFDSWALAITIAFVLIWCSIAVPMSPLFVTIVSLSGFATHLAWSLVWLHQTTGGLSTSLLLGGTLDVLKESTGRIAITVATEHESSCSYTRLMQIRLPGILGCRARIRERDTWKVVSQTELQQALTRCLHRARV